LEVILVAQPSLY